MHPFGIDGGHVIIILSVYAGFYTLYCIVGLFVSISLSQLHSWVNSLSLFIC